MATSTPGWATDPPLPGSMARGPSTLAAVDVVDIVLIVVVIVAALHGLRLGALIQLFTFGGFWIGLTVGALVASPIARAIHSTNVKAFVALAVVFGVALIFGVGGRIAGSWSNAAAKRLRLGLLDSGLGVIVAVVAALLSAWLVASVVSGSRYTWLNSEVQRSDILKTVDSILPPVPSLFSQVQSFLSAEGFPPVFAELAPPLASPVPVPSSSQAQGIASGASPSTVKILGEACGDLQEGSGFVVQPGLVVTNAHVVAGEPLTEVEVGGNYYRARPVLFDPQFDLAVLRTDAPLGPPLPIDGADVGRGTKGAVVGYPEDGPLTVVPAGVTANLQAEGRDIYNSGLVVRDVYQLEADVRPGNSGGPLLDAQQVVIGVVFSRSTVEANVGYALASPGVLSRVQEAESKQATVSTGACVSD
jgi:S1-C subfamily serine protease